MPEELLWDETELDEDVLSMDMGERCLGQQPYGGEDKTADAVFNAVKQQKERASHGGGSA